MPRILLFALPLAIGFGGDTELTKVFIAEVVIGILIVLQILKPTIKIANLWPLGLLGALMLVTGGNWLGNGFRLQGVFLSLVLLAWAALVSVTAKIPKWLPWGLLLALLGLTALVDPVFGRAVATLGEPNALAATAVFAWPFGGLWASIPALAIVWLSGSRSGLVAGGVQLVMWVLAASTWRRHALFAGYLLWAGALILPMVDSPRIWESRVEIWQTALHAGLRKPLLGWGFGNTTTGLRETAVGLNNTVQYQFIDSSHNMFLDWWVQGGVLGVGLLGYLLFSGLTFFAKSAQTEKLVALMGVGIVLSFNPASVVTLVHFWWLIGQSLNRSDHDAQVVQRGKPVKK